jgi:predicted NAD/FAD-binding protein
MRLAIIGTGISGLVVAHLLAADHELTIFEAGARVGGHTHTVTVERGGKRHDLDTGFIVCNNRTYPNFLRLLSKLGVATQPSDMSFSVHCESSGLEYSGGSLRGLFAQPGNLFRWSFHRMLRDIFRFNREAPALLKEPGDGPELGDYLRSSAYSAEFIDFYMLPMAAAIWSAEPAQIWRFPAKFLVHFCQNHGLLSIFDRPQWMTVAGGSQRYIDKIIEPFRDRIRLQSAVALIHRNARGVIVTTREGRADTFDHAIVAAHGDQALAMLTEPTVQEREVLGAFAFQENEVVLHTDTKLMPTCRGAWASWNYHVPRQPAQRATVTYHLNRLQNLRSDDDFCVTLNRTDAIDPGKILRKIIYHHPVYSHGSFAAQKRWAEVSGVNRIHYCGAYWGYGFHEDGVNSALAVGCYFGASL